MLAWREKVLFANTEARREVAQRFCARAGMIRRRTAAP